MNNVFKKTWEQYVLSWKVESVEEKQALFETCLDSDCLYMDPLSKVKGWSELVTYMLDFHKQLPGGHFVTTYFLAHHNKSIARWEMRSGDDQVMGDGISYGEYNQNNKLISMTGFFETP